MASYYYKILFEIQILHEYYLAKPDNSGFFALSDPEQQDILTSKIANNQYDIWKDIRIEPTSECQKLLIDHHIRFVPTSTGFIAGIEVTPQAGQFFPFIPLSKDVKFSFLMKITDPFFGNISNIKLQANIPAIFYYSNLNPGNKKQFPFLSIPVENFSSGKYYEMGQLAKIGTKIKEALVRTKTSTPSKWNEVGAIGLSHEGDRIAISNRFFYRFDPEINVQQVVFTLKTKGGDEVKKITIAQNGRIDRVPLDFREDDNQIKIPNGFYNLEATGNGGYNRTHPVYLYSELVDTTYFGLLVMDNSESDPDFSFTNAGGELKIPHPVFVIRLKSRKTYWRYKSNIGKSLVPIGNAIPYLTPSGAILSSKKPRILTRNPSEFISENPAEERIYLPNPPVPAIRQENDGKIYSDIYISKIKDLIDVS